MCGSTGLYWESDSESDGYERGLDLDKLLDMDEWKEFDEQEDQEDLISHEEMLSADEEAGLWDCRNQTWTEQDRDNIAASHLKLISNMPHVCIWPDATTLFAGNWKAVRISLL
ncbi:hypothetical protein B0H14DRAFT_2652143 [Mycena olivaceomarginata]|nr:hypothetical protein B0H14DRAFT_2652143 [Mycena olivaceomarginata]